MFVNYTVKTAHSKNPHKNRKISYLYLKPCNDYKQISVYYNKASSFNEVKLHQQIKTHFHHNYILQVSVYNKTVISTNSIDP